MSETKTAEGAAEVREGAHATGSRTLRFQARAHRLNEWQYSKFAPRVRGDILEVGAGLGSMSRLVARGARSLVATEVEDDHLLHLRSEFSTVPNVQVECFDLEGPPPPAIAARSFDVVISANVIEHLRDDGRAVRRLASLLRPGGWMLTYVPACPWAFSGMDSSLGHYRRYTTRTFRDLMRGAGLEVRRLEYMNMVGLLGWWVNGRVLGRRVVSARQAAAFEHIVPVVRLEDRLPVRVPVGLGVIAHAQKPC